MSEPRAYYNEIDSDAAEWLRNLIAEGHIAPGDVDERSIEDVRPADLVGYTQCHFFAGIGIWSYALRGAGWPDDRPVWTGSCPCQPFSLAGKGKGFADERHLWPAWDWLIGQCQPAIVFGEQVEGKDGLVWHDLVSADLEAKGYAFGAAITPAAGFGLAFGETVWADQLDRAIHDCPDTVVAGQLRDFANWAGSNIGVGGSHIRHRQYWVACRMADATYDLEHGRGAGGPGGRNEYSDCGPTGRMGIPDDAGSQPGRQGGATARHGRSIEPAGSAGGVGNSHGTRTAFRLPELQERQERDAKINDNRSGGLPRRHKGRSGFEPSPATNAPDGIADAEWLFCRDGSWRPVEPGTFPLADASSARVVRLRAYGNGLDAQAAQAFIEAAIPGLAAAMAEQWGNTGENNG